MIAKAAHTGNLQTAATLAPDHSANASARAVNVSESNGEERGTPGDHNLAEARNAQLHRAIREKNQETAKSSFFLKDTKAWGVQVWMSFGISLFLCGVGLAYLPGADLDRAFMVMGYVFCLSTAFVLSKFVRDNAMNKSDTPLFGAVVYAAFAAALALTGWGLFRMNIPDSYKAYLLVSWLYLITTTFTLAKTLRDRHEIALLEARATSGR